jgi:amidophosphoribosyltransferase
VVCGGTSVGCGSEGTDSESVALTALGYEITRDIIPSEAIVIDRQGNIFTQQCASASKYSP